MTIIDKTQKQPILIVANGPGMANQGAAINFVEIWPMILEEIPDAEIHVFSKTTLYSEVNQRDNQGWGAIAEKLVQLPGMILREPIPQRLLIQEMHKSWLMLYPNSGFVESSCGSALQSMAVGTPIITTNRAGLPETVGNGGICIEQNEEEWKENFAKTVVELYRNTKKRQEMANSGRQQTMSQSWDKKATERVENSKNYLMNWSPMRQV